MTLAAGMVNMKPQTTCPVSEELQAFVDGHVDADERPALAEHLEHCPSCQQRLQDLAADSGVWRRARRHLRDEDTEPTEELERVVARVQEFALETRTIPDTDSSAALDFLEPAVQLDSLGRLAHYTVQEVIGRGGMGVVLKAFDERLRRTVAIKVLAPHLAADSGARDRFVCEAQAVARVRDEHVVEVHAVEEVNGLPCMIMEHIAGCCLQERLNRAGPSDLKETVRIGCAVARGLAAAHAKGLVHRDVKPANILIEDSTGRIKLTDFGLARVVDETSRSAGGEVAGTPPYMAPEQLHGRAVDYRADLFSLGSVLYALCTGAAPFAANNTLAVLQRVREDRPFPIRALNPEAPEWLVAIIEKLHAKDPADRIQSAAEVAELLSRGGSDQEAGGRRQGSEVRDHGATGKRRATFGWLVAGAVLALGVLAAFFAGPTVYRFVTNQGQLVVETDDADVKVEAKGPEITIIDTKTQRTVTLKAGRYELELVAGPPGLRLVTTEFTLERGGKQIVRVRLEPVEPGETAEEIRRFEHDGIAHAVAFADNGRRVLSGGWDGTVRYWNAETGEEVSRFDFEEDGKKRSVICVAVSPDGRRALAGDRSGTAWLLDLDKGKVLQRDDYPRTAEQGTHGITRVAFAADGRQALLASFDGVVRVWDVQEWKELRRFRHEEQGLWSVDVSRDGRYALTAGGLGGRGVIRIWDLKKGEVARRFNERTSGFWHAVFSPDGLRVLSAGGDKTMRLWDTATGKELGALVHADQVRDVAFSSDGRLALTASVDGVVRLWDAATRRELHRFTGHRVEVNAVSFSPDGRRAVSASRDKTVRLWELPNGTKGKQ